ncbi:hypothetical protein RT99_05210 [Flavobacterium sp. MEB061]|uniref:hypothetical protein n=1 Tax=Flavobacterium sp. MEB061 TaxID=1587524 RepID=UPI0005ACA0F4|nr:hypothetical protein [Flavobacterium sp. MEB061]KIQ23048.1 hypothetical protein RT99_05210 [Flavobacterium sp. MEB061]
MNNIKIDQILKNISETEHYEMKDEDDFENHTDYIEYHSLLLIMIDDLKLLIKPISNNRIIYLSSYGLEVINKGGWLNNLHIQNEENKINSEKEKYDFLSKKWIYRTRFLPYILSLIAIILSILTFILNINKENDNLKLRQEIEIIKTKINKQNLKQKN